MESQKTKGTWQFKSEKDPRWNCEGAYTARFGMDHPREAIDKFVELNASFGDSPDDLIQVYVSSGLVS